MLVLADVTDRPEPVRHGLGKFRMKALSSIRSALMRQRQTGDRMQRYPGAVVTRPHWSRGDRLYHEYWGPNYYVDDWQAYHLRRPPRGYRWVHVDNDFLLVAITTGIIFDLMLNQDRYDHH
jgi:Ni/Co efflux regulator RcnB